MSPRKEIIWSKETRAHPARSTVFDVKMLIAVC
jgi:hypothetical protein